MRGPFTLSDRPGGDRVMFYRYGGFAPELTIFGERMPTIVRASGKCVRGYSID